MRSHIARNPLPVVLFTIFIDLVGFGILIPVIPQLLANPASEFFLLPKNFTINQGYIILGFLTAVFPIGQFLATPILGQLSDKYGRRKLLALSLFGTSLSYVIFAFGIMTKNIPLLFAARFFDGVTGGNISIAQAAIADVTKPENRAKTFGLIGAVFGIGFILGPYIGGKLSDPTLVSWFNATTPFWFAAILAFTNAMSVVLLFPETLVHVQEHLQLKFDQSIRNITKAFTLPNLRSIFLVNFLFQGGFTFYTTFFSVFLINRFSFTQGNIGDYFSYVGIWIAFTQAVVTRQLSKRLKEYQVLEFSLIACAAVILIYFLTNAWWQLLLVVPFFALFMGISQANMTALVSRSADSKIQGEVLGINASVQALAQSIPPILSGFIASGLDPLAPIIFSVIVMAFAGITFNLLYKPTSLSHSTDTIPVAE